MNILHIVILYAKVSDIVQKNYAGIFYIAFAIDKFDSIWVALSFILTTYFWSWIL